LQPRNLLDAADDDLPVNSPAASKLADQLAQRDRRVLDLPDEERAAVRRCTCVGPQDLELAELRAVEHCPPRGAPYERGRGRGAENVCDAIPISLNSAAPRISVASSTLGRPLSGTRDGPIFACLCPTRTLDQTQVDRHSREAERQSRKRDPGYLPHSTLQIRPVRRNHRMLCGAPARLGWSRKPTSA